MELSLRRWKPGHLLASWGAYWTGLLGVGLGPALLAGWRATRLPDGHGTIQAGFDSGSLSFTVVEEGVKTFAATTPFSTAMVWLVGPPLLLWAAWLITRRKPNDAATSTIGRAPHGALNAGTGPAADVAVSQKEKVTANRGRSPAG